MSTAVLERPAAERPPEDVPQAERAFVTLTVADQLCGVPVLAVRDVLGPQTITRIPLAPPEIAGSLNLRGRIVTAIDLRRRLRLPPPPRGQWRACPWSPNRAANFMRCWWTRSARCSTSRRAPSSAIRRRFRPPGLRTAPASTGCRIGSWWCWTSAGCSPSRRTRKMPELPGQTRHCLVVDDSRVVRKVARRILEGHGFVVTEAEDGRVALDCCRRQHARLACCSIGTCRSWTGWSS